MGENGRRRRRRGDVKGKGDETRLSKLAKGEKFRKGEKVKGKARQGKGDAMLGKGRDGVLYTIVYPQWPPQWEFNRSVSQ